MGRESGQNGEIHGELPSQSSASQHALHRYGQTL
jgi:hypothetical protein